MNIRPKYKIQVRHIFSLSFFPPIKLQFSQPKTSAFYVPVEIEKNRDTGGFQGVGRFRGLAVSQ